MLECSSRLESLELVLVRRLEHLLRIELLVSESRIAQSAVDLVSELVEIHRSAEPSDYAGPFERQCCADSEPSSFELR